MESRLLMSAVLWEENFNELAYGPNREETVHPADNVWTNVPPPGWVKDDTHVPGYNNPDLPPDPLPDPPPDPLPGPGNEDNNGVTEWIGWTFADRDWWVQAAGDQRRVEFTKASGGVMVADNDEWDDAMHPPQAAPGDPKFQTEEDLYNAFITTSSIPLTGAKPGTYAFEFDSSWRPEGFDDGTNINNQTGIIEAIYSDGTTEEIIHWDSDPTGVFFHDHMPNEHVTVPLTIPAGATSVKFRLSELHSANDWWWAVDNLALTGAKDAPGAKLVGVTGNDGTAATNENLYNIGYTTGGAPVTATQLLDLPSVPDGDVIGFNPETGLLHHLSGGSSTSNEPADPNYRDNHFMETIDVASGANTQKAIYNANSEQFGLTAPRPTFVLPATRRTDAQTDSTVRDDAGPGEYLLARDVTWSATEHAFLLADYNGIYKLKPDGTQSTLIGDPALGSGEVSGLSFFRVNGQNLLFATQRDGPGLFILNPATGEYLTDPFIVTLPDGTPVGGILSLEPSADQTALLGLAKDPSDPTKVMLIQIDFGIETDNGSNDVKSATATPIGEFDVPIRDLAVVVPTSSGPLASAVSQVFVNGQGMTGQSSANGVAFRNLAGIDNTYGYPIPAGTAQTKSIPWSNGINKISLRFTQEVASQLQQADLVVRGSTNATYAVSGFTYDAATKTGTWTLTNAIVNDKVRLFLDDALVGGLDGEWQNANAAEAYPSGDGSAGGDFDFRFNVLRGDANQDGAVNALDLGQLKAKLNRTATNPGTGTTGYSVFADLNADGQINALDLGIGKARLNTRLPSTDPASALLFSSQPISR